MEKSSTTGREAQDLEDYSYTALQLGVWRLFLPRESFSIATELSPSHGLSLLWSKWKALESLIPLIWRFLGEIYRLSPGLVLLDLILRFGVGFERTLMLYASARLLRTVTCAFTRPIEFLTIDVLG